MENKLELLASIEGYDDSQELLEASVTNSVCPGICINEGCDFTTGIEPDCEDGWCEECETATVKSCLVLANLI